MDIIRKGWRNTGKEVIFLKTKEKLLELFESNKGIYFSGEELAQKLSVSRTAVWKAVNGLRDEGYEIDAVQNRGYRLSPDTDILSAQGIIKYLNPCCGDLKIEVVPAADSTNTWLRTRAESGAQEGAVAVACCQTQGKGRVGRSFFSPQDTGIYMSILLRPYHFLPDQAVKITTMAAVSVCRAIEAVSQKAVGIKWVNDIFMENRKVGGILTEGSMGLEEGFLDYIVLGIGVNVYSPKGGFPRELKQTAGAVFQTHQNDGKNRIAAAILNDFMDQYRTEKKGQWVEEYRRRCFVLGREILVLGGTRPEKARALDVDENCRLLVEYEDGRRQALSCGEISVRI